MALAFKPTRYDSMPYRRCGRSGLQLPALSLGFWQNFGEARDLASAAAIVCHAFDCGITHFDLANNYGPPPGAAEELVGRILADELAGHRDELIVSSKAGHLMWPGPYGNFGSRKYLIASADQSLRRLGLDYLDIFYSHRFDPATPLEETMGALADIVRRGKALYVGISSYPQEQTRQAHALLKAEGVPLLIHQPSYSALNRWIETDGLIDACGELGVGVIAYSTLAQGLLSGKHAGGQSAAARVLPDNHLEARVLDAVGKLKAIAEARGQTLAQLALACVLHRPEIASALIGVRTLEQLDDNLGALRRLEFSADELSAIERATAGGLIDRRPRW